ncbi:MAG: hypothetical protein H6621_12630 [Halobacteriovoraceae bacterium]|nr:hypothetical protein [Halobacteriovoraceae bacterium]MCB9095906.1 hypothetical protein [Halobacteriovoraceae bacterium]
MKFILTVFLFNAFIYSNGFSSENKSKATLSEEYLTKKVDVAYNGKSLSVYIHYPQNRVHFAYKLTKVIKNDFKKVHEYFHYIPQAEVHMVVAPSATTANGAAGVFPRNLIYLHDFPPLDFDTLSISKDWVRILAIHEYIHVVAMEMTGGFFNFMRNFLGSFAKWAAVAPRWYHEGIATWGETHFTEEGRLRHPWIKAMFLDYMAKRTSCKELVCLESPRRYPFGQMAYWFGAFFFEYVENQKEGNISCIVEDYSRNLPFMIGNSLADCTGKDLDETFEEFVDYYEKEALKREPFCGFEDKPFCKSIRRKYTTVNWFKGFIDRGNLRAFVIQPNKEERPYHRETGERLIVYDKISKKFKNFFLDRVIENIYMANGDQNKFFISYYEFYAGDIVRKFAYYDHKKKNVKFLNFDESIKLNSCDYYLGESEGTHYCLAYKNSHWSVFKSGKEKEERIRDFPALTNVVPESQKNNILEVEVEKTPIQKGKTVKINLKEKKVFKDKDKKLKESEDYWGIKYMAPHFLMLDYFVFGDIESYGIITSMNDPLNRHLLSLSGYYSSGVPSDKTPYSGSAVYAYTKDKYSYALGYNKYISQGDLGVDEVNIFENKFATITRSSYLGNTSWAQSLTGLKSNEEDLFFSRKITRFRMGQSFLHSTNSLTSVYRQFHFEFNPSWSENEGYDPYLGGDTKLSFNFKFSENFGMSIEGTYGKLYKTDKALASSPYRDGVIYGGGASSAFTSAYQFPSYLIPYANIFGNEMTQGRLEFAYNFSNPFFTTNFIPFYLKRLYLLAGSEYISSDILLQSDQLANGGSIITIRRNPSILSYYGGLRTNFDFFYILPISLDWIYSVSGDEYYNNNFSLVLNTNVYF